SFDLPRQVAELRARRMHDRELAAGDPRRGIAAQRIGFEHIAQPMQHRCALLIAEALLQRLDLGHGQERELCRLARSLDFLEALGGEFGKAPGIMESARRVARLRKRQRLCRGIGLAQADIDIHRRLPPRSMMRIGSPCARPVFDSSFSACAATGRSAGAIRSRNELEISRSALLPKNTSRAPAAKRMSKLRSISNSRSAQQKASET